MLSYDIIVRPYFHGDLWVHNLQFKDSISIRDNLAIRSTFRPIQYKIFAPKEGNKLAIKSNLDKTRVHKYEKVAPNIGIKAVVPGTLTYRVALDPSSLAIHTGDLPIKSIALIKVSSDLAITSSKVGYFIYYILYGTTDNIGIKSEDLGDLKQSFEKVDSSLAIDAPDLPMTRILHNVVPLVSDLAITTPDIGLHAMAFNVVDDNIGLKDTFGDLQHVAFLDGIDDDIVIDSTFASNVQKFEQATSDIGLSSTLTDVNIVYLELEEDSIGISNDEINAVLQHYRLLEEVDPNSDADIDEMTLRDLDYIIIE